MRWALIIQYNGYAYRGWQSQKDCIYTIQAQLELALSKVADEIIKVYAAGRTDAGVHANSQVIHFETLINREVKAWIFGTNYYLPNDISVLAAYQVDDDFHARFKAFSRSYEYVIYNAPARAALLNGRVAWECKRLEVTKMSQAAQLLIGEHDFSAFRGPHCQAASPIKTIKRLQLIRVDHYIRVLITANGFLHHMVRNIVGTLMLIGFKKEPVSWMRTVINSRDRKQAGITAPAAGLYLTGIKYPSNYQSVNSFIEKNRFLLF